ncbi:MAG: hypothetical protein ACPHY8_03345 [Patescibacteria group bacterium]
MEKLLETHESEKLQNYSKQVQDYLEEVPSWVGMFLVEPKNPAAKIDLLTKFRKLKAANDEKDSLSLHEYYSNK